MPQVTAYRCPFTNKLFSLQKKDDYIKHLKTLRKVYSRARMIARVRQEWADVLAEGKRTVSSLEDLGHWVINNSTLIGRHSKAVHSSPPSNDFRITEISFILPRYSSCCSNTHSAPVGKKSNWGGEKPGIPRGYPGIYCNIEFKTVGAKPAYMGDIFSSVQIYLGTGGSRGDGQYHYASIIWLEDWPRIEEAISMAILKNELYGGRGTIIIIENS